MDESGHGSLNQQAVSMPQRDFALEGRISMLMFQRDQANNQIVNLAAEIAQLRGALTANHATPDALEERKRLDHLKEVESKAALYEQAKAEAAEAKRCAVQNDQALRELELARERIRQLQHALRLHQQPAVPVAPFASEAARESSEYHVNGSAS